MIFQFKRLPLVFKKIAIIRKLIALISQIPRNLKLFQSFKEDYYKYPPILVNSFPKSGTHLLLQIIEAFPQTKNYGSFVASMPSITFQERSQSGHTRILRKITPSEIVSGHLFYDAEYEHILNSLNCVHFFIYRDPRDVAISEAHYLTSMNKWHRLHRYFHNLQDDNARISQSITGIHELNFPYDYPDIGKRFKRYEGWLNSSSVMSVKYEDLMGENRQYYVRQIVEFYMKKCQRDLPNVEALVESAMNNINPTRSHTFRKGVTQQWKSVFTRQHHEQMEKVAGDLLVKLGYEK